MNAGSRHRKNGKSDSVNTPTNIFADLDLPNADALDVKAQLLHRMMTTLDEEGWSDADASKVTGLRSPTIAAIRAGRFTSIKMEDLIYGFTAMGRNVDITIRKPRRRKKIGTLRVVTG